MIFFMTSKVHLGVKGISAPYFPFFLPEHEINDLEIFVNTLIVKRESKKEMRIKIQWKDIKNLQNGINTFQKNVHTSTAERIITEAKAKEL